MDKSASGQVARATGSNESLGSETANIKKIANVNRKSQLHRLIHCTDSVLQTVLDERMHWIIRRDISLFLANLLQS